MASKSNIQFVLMSMDFGFIIMLHIGLDVCVCARACMRVNRSVICGVLDVTRCT